MARKKELGEDFPALSEELEEGKTKVYKAEGVSTVSDKSDATGAEGTFLPDVVDYIRRCDTESQAVEIVDFMVKRREISESEASEIKKKLRLEGLRSFGAKKERDHYSRFGLE